MLVLLHCCVRQRAWGKISWCNTLVNPVFDVIRSPWWCSSLVETCRRDINLRFVFRIIMWTPLALRIYRYSLTVDQYFSVFICFAMKVCSKSHWMCEFMNCGVQSKNNNHFPRKWYCDSHPGVRTLWEPSSCVKSTHSTKHKFSSYRLLLVLALSSLLRGKSFSLWRICIVTL